MPASGQAARCAPRRSRASGRSRSSESRNSKNSPWASAAPRLRAADTPAWAWRISRSLDSATPSATSAVPSVEPSSTTMSSQSAAVWRRTLSIVSPTYRAVLNAGTMTENRGGRLNRIPPRPMMDASCHNPCEWGIPSGHPGESAREAPRRVATGERRNPRHQVRPAGVRGCIATPKLSGVSHTRSVRFSGLSPPARRFSGGWKPGESPDSGPFMGLPAPVGLSRSTSLSAAPEGAEKLEEHGPVSRR